MLFPLYNDFRDDSDYKPPSTEQQLQTERILACREKRRVNVCSSCSFYDDCNLVKDFLKRFGGLGSPPTDGGAP